MMDNLDRYTLSCFVFLFFVFFSSVSVVHYCLAARPASCFLINSATIESIADSIPLLE
jgi:hypothetical protein